MALSATTTIAEAPFVLSPNTMYYVALYCLVILVRFFKLKKEESPEKPFGLMNVFHVGLELVYTASGLVVLLLVDLKEYAAFIVIGYLGIVIISSQIETMAERFSEKTVFFTHIAILMLIVFTTIWYFQFVQPPIDMAAKGTKMHRIFRVAIPYHDMALRKYIGTAFGARQLVFVTDIEAQDESDAKQKAKAEFREKVSPFQSRRLKATDADLIANLDQTIVKLLE